MKHMPISTAETLHYERGDLFLGADRQFRQIGTNTDRHAITIAGSRAGKGACVIIPNLLRWPHNALVIDPKGENASATYQARLKLGKSVYVLDPFQSADVPDQLRASFNPLTDIDPESLSAAEDIEVIADGLVKRSDPKHAQWDDGAAAILAGIIAYIVLDAPPENRTLQAIRDVLLQSRDDLYADAQRMMSFDGCGGLVKAAGVSIMAAIDSEKGMEKDFLDGARRHSKWLDRDSMKSVLGHSSFSLSELKNGNATVYVVLPPQYLETHAAFMRLFVRCAINVMAAGGSGKGEKCLFILDEFFALGRIDEIAKAAGLMPSYGVHLWPFLQDISQLRQLYQEGWETFFANADLHQFFGNSDMATLEYISSRLGTVDTSEIALPPSAPATSSFDGGQMISALSGGSKKGSSRVIGGLVGGAVSAGMASSRAHEQADYQTRMSNYQREMARHGRPRYTPDQIAADLKKDEKPTAVCNLSFVKGDPKMLINLPYFTYDIYDDLDPNFDWENKNNKEEIIKEN